jgi:DegV family protein with EDD domain
MSKVCILTDSTVQFPIPAFEGRSLVHFASLHVELDGVRYEKGEGIKAADMPVSLKDGTGPVVVPTGKDEFERLFTALGGRYDEIVAILQSADLTASYENAAAAVKTLQGQVPVQLIDAHTTATGLGLVVQAAAAMAEQGLPADEIDLRIRNLISRVYSVFCIPGLTYLHSSGYLTAPQAAIGEYIKMLPVYVLENGKLSATQKARNLRHLVDILHEFLFEFEHLEHIGLLQGVPPFENETRALRERIAEDFPHTSISEHTISAPLAGILGPHSLGMFVMQAEVVE